MVGSYVPKTTEQVKNVLDRQLATSVEINVEHLLDALQRPGAIQLAAAKVDYEIANGRQVMLYTSRKLVRVTDQISNLEIGRQVSSGLIQTLHHLQNRPRYILAKGGITSHDVATKGLGVQRAMVLGQICQGISVWQLGPETRFPGLNYIVFPGNIGEPETLADVISKLSQ
jgi:uncharacterized protein YgbK (DUF1537 family)